MKTRNKYNNLLAFLLVIFYLLTLAFLWNPGSESICPPPIRTGWDNGLYSAKAALCRFASENRIPCWSAIKENNSLPPALIKELKPGDLIFTHRRGYISNFFIPGYWKHAALYLGTDNDIFSMTGRSPAECGIICEDGPWMIEAVNPGVQVNTLDQLANACEILIVRPNMPAIQKKKAVLNALAMIGLPYDFDFDFRTAGRIGCTELIWRSYREHDIFEVKRMLGKPFTTPDEIVAESGNHEKDNPTILLPVYRVRLNDRPEINPPCRSPFSGEGNLPPMIAENKQMIWFSYLQKLKSPSHETLHSNAK